MPTLMAAQHMMSVLASSPESRGLLAVPGNTGGAAASVLVAEMAHVLASLGHVFDGVEDQTNATQIVALALIDRLRDQLLQFNAELLTERRRELAASGLQRALVFDDAARLVDAALDDGADDDDQGEPDSPRSDVGGWERIGARTQEFNPMDGDSDSDDEFPLTRQMRS